MVLASLAPEPSFYSEKVGWEWGCGSNNGWVLLIAKLLNNQNKDFLYVNNSKRFNSMKWMAN